jgi:protein HOOK3
LQEEKAAGGGQKVVVLQHLLNDANRLKSKFEKSYIEVSQERDILQSDMARIREGIPDAMVDKSSNVLSMRLHTIELEKEIKSLNENVKKLEQKIAEGRYYGDEDGDDNIRSKYNELETKSKQLEEQVKKQLQDINKLLLEKDHLKNQSIEQKDLLLEKERLNSEMKASLAAFEAKDDEPLKQRNAQLQQQLIQLQEELHELKRKHRNAQEVSCDI